MCSRNPRRWKQDFEGAVDWTFEWHWSPLQSRRPPSRHLRPSKPPTDSCGAHCPPIASGLSTWMANSTTTLVPVLPTPGFYRYSLVSNKKRMERSPSLCPLWAGDPPTLPRSEPTRLPTPLSVPWDLLRQSRDSALS